MNLLTYSIEVKVNLISYFSSVLQCVFQYIVVKVREIRQEFLAGQIKHQKSLHLYMWQRNVVELTWDPLDSYEHSVIFHIYC